MGKALRPTQRRLGARERLLGMAAEPQDAPQVTQAAHLGVMRAETVRIGATLEIVQRLPLVRKRDGSSCILEPPAQR